MSMNLEIPLLTVFHCEADRLFDLLKASDIKGNKYQNLVWITQFPPWHRNSRLVHMKLSIYQEKGSTNTH